MSKAINFLGGIGLAVARARLMKPKKGTAAVPPVPQGAAVEPAAPEDPTFLDRAGQALGAAATQVGDGFSSAWDRIKAGNIDQVGSEAYDRWGEGARIGQAQTDAGTAAAQSAQNPWADDSATMETPQNVSAQSPEFHSVSMPDFEFPAQA